MAREIEYEIMEQLGILREKENGYSVQANIISWSEGAPKVDIRNWSADGKPLKGITLTLDEAQLLAEIILTKCNS